MSGYVLPVHAFWKMGVEKTDAVKQEKQADKVMYKDITKQKDIPFKKWRTKNKFEQ